MTETLDIQVVIDGCIANNRKAQEYLYRQYYSYAMVIAQRYSRDDADAADIPDNLEEVIAQRLASQGRPAGGNSTR